MMCDVYMSNDCEPSYCAYSLMRLSYLHKIHYWGGGGGGGGLNAPFFLRFLTLKRVVFVLIAREATEDHHGKTAEDDIICIY